jgi:hypothetical protein
VPIIERTPGHRYPEIDPEGGPSGLQSARNSLLSVSAQRGPEICLEALSHLAQPVAQMVQRSGL